MDKIIESAKRIRDFVNENDLYDKCFRSFLDKWNLLTVAMDTLEDASLGLTEFEKHGVGTTIAEKYLRLYGFFQAIILQQDAISSLYETFLKIKLAQNPQSAWDKLRTIRNMATGHPLDRGGKPEEGKLRIFLVQTSISDSQFELMICVERTGKTRFETIPYKEIFQDYKAEVLSYLSEIENSQKSFVDATPPATSIL